MRLLARGVTVVALALGAAVLLAAPASAHAQLVRSQPSSGSSLANAPENVRLWFDEGVATNFATARLVDRDGQTVHGTRVDASRAGAGLVTVDMPDLGVGTYGVVWRVLAEDDGHTSTGVIVFDVGDDVPAAGIAALQDAGAPGGPGPIDVLLRWLRLCFLSGLFGGLGVAGLVLGRAAASDPAGPAVPALRSAQARLVALAAAGAALAAATGLVEELRRLVSLHADGSAAEALVRLVTDTRPGRIWLGQEVLLLVSAVALALVVRAGATASSGRLATRRATGAITLVVGLSALEALGSHAAALDQDRFVATAGASLHVVAACLWLGAVPALLLTLWGPGTDPSTRGALVRSCRRPFTTLAASSVGVLVVTGLYGAGRQVATVDALVTTEYGQLLLVKSALLLLMGGLGLTNSTRLHERALGPRRRIVRPAQRLSVQLIAVEAAVGALLLCAVAVLVGTVPARGPGLGETAAADASGPIMSRSVADVVIAVSATPDRRGVNGFTVLAASSMRPPPGAIDDLELQLRGPRETTVVPMRQIEPGRYFGTGQIGDPAPSEVTVTLVRSNERLTTSIPWRMAPTPEGPAQNSSDRRLSLYTNLLASLVLAGGLITAAVRGTRRQREHHEAEAVAAVPQEAVVEVAR